MKGECAMPQKAIEAVLEQAVERFMALPGVVGVGQGECAGSPCIKVLVVEKTPELVERISSEIEGYAVEVEETGEIRALGDE